MNIMVSKCLLGYNCRYKGDSCQNDKVIALSKDHNLIPVCPECLGGLQIPRDPSERIGSMVFSSKGKDVTAEYEKGAKETLKIAKENNIDYAILKAKSPSCGKGLIYDGTFTGTKIPGNGVTTDLLLKNGFKVITEEDL